MMREIKFRGKEVGSGKWIYGYYVKDEEWAHEYIFNSQKQGIYYHLTKTQITPSTKGQYIGLKDKNGKEIYKGDIIKSDGSYPLEVYWMGLAWGTKWKDMGHNEEEIICDDGGDMTIGKGNVLIYMQVIGNKWENKELMGG